MKAVNPRTCHHIWAVKQTFSLPEQGIGVFERLCSECGMSYDDWLEMAAAEVREDVAALRTEVRKVQESGSVGAEKSARFRHVWGYVKNRYDVTTYRDIARHLFPHAYATVDAYDPSTDSFSV